MANAMLMDNGRHAFRAPKLGQRKPVGAKVTVKNCKSAEPTETRRKRHAAETNSKRSLWK